MEVISVANRKGGIGKTVSAVNISMELSFLGKKVLMIDLDSQCDLTKIYKTDADFDIYDVLREESSLEKAIVQTPNSESLYLLEGSQDIVHWNERDQEQRLKEELVRLKKYQEKEKEEEFDYVIIDHPPNFNEAALTGIVASDFLLIVLEPESFCLDNVNSLLEDVGNIQKTMNEEISILGMLINRVDRRRNLTEKMLNKIRKAFGGQVFNASISNNTIVPESIHAGLSLRGMYENRDWYSKVLSEFKDLVSEIETRLGGVSDGDGQAVS